MKTIDSEYQTPKRFVSEYPHAYGSQVHILADPVLLHLTAILSDQSTKPKQLPELIRQLTQGLLHAMLTLVAPISPQEVCSRMVKLHSAARFNCPQLDRSQAYVVVSLARAGIVPAQLCYEELLMLLGSSQVRQDHFFCERHVGKNGHVQGTDIVGSKVGGSVQDAILLIPDPMGATGHTLCEVLDYYHRHRLGKPKHIVALHAIVAPEYVRRMQQKHPEVVVVAARLDRGLSPSHVLQSPFGKFKDEEKGLDQHDYIVPGAGGVGELLNNTPK